MDNQPYLPLNNGRQMPQLGLGTWELTGKECYETVRLALDIGYRYIDTAKIYGNEKEVGQAVRDSGIAREKVFVTTKLWNDDHLRVQEAFKESLELLGLGYIDLYLIHWPIKSRITAYKTLETLDKTDLLKAIGVSNFTEDHINEILQVAKTPPVVDQIEFNPFLYQKDLLNYLEQKNIKLVAHSPLARGVKFDHPTLKHLSEVYGKSPAQIMLRWAIEHGVAVIPKATSKEHLEENFDIFSWHIDPHDVLLLDNLNENLRLSWDPTNM